MLFRMGKSSLVKRGVRASFAVFIFCAPPGLSMQVTAEDGSVETDRLVQETVTEKDLDNEFKQVKENGLEKSSAGDDGGESGKRLESAPAPELDREPIRDTESNKKGSELMEDITEQNRDYVPESVPEIEEERSRGYVPERIPEPESEMSRGYVPEDIPDVESEQSADPAPDAEPESKSASEPGSELEQPTKSKPEQKLENESAVDDDARLAVATAFVQAIAEINLRHMLAISTPIFQEEILKVMKISEMDIDQVDATADPRWAAPVFLGSEGTEGRWQYDFARSDRPDKWKFGVVLIKVGDEYLVCGFAEKGNTLGEVLP